MSDVFFICILLFFPYEGLLLLVDCVYSLASEVEVEVPVVALLVQVEVKWSEVTEEVVVEWSTCGSGRC